MMIRDAINDAWKTYDAIEKEPKVLKGTPLDRFDMHLQGFWFKWHDEVTSNEGVMKGAFDKDFQAFWAQHVFPRSGVPCMQGKLHSPYRCKWRTTAEGTIEHDIVGPLWFPLAALLINYIYSV